MKILIWLGCAFCYGLIVALLMSLDIALGGLPAMCLFGCMIAAGHYCCKKYDEYKKATQEEPELSKPIVPVHVQSEPKPAHITVPKATEEQQPVPPISSPSQTSYKKAYTIALVVSACLFLICVVLGLHYYFDTKDLKQTIANHEQTIQQLEADLHTAKTQNQNLNTSLEDAIKRTTQTLKDAEFQYNYGFSDGYIQGYNDSISDGWKAETIDTQVEELVIMARIQDYLFDFD